MQLSKNELTRSRLQYLISSLFILLLAIGAPFLAVANNNASDRKSNTIATGGAFNPFEVPTAGWDGVIVMANITSVDVTKFLSQVRFIFLSVGKYDTNLTDAEQFSMKLNFTTLGSRSTIDTLELNPNRAATFPILLGDPTRYPFDEYYSDFFISIKEAATGIPVPIAFGIVGNVMGWTVTPFVTTLPLDSIGVGYVMTRGWITIFFSIFVNVIMWVLSTTVLILASTLWFRDRKVEPSTIGVSTGLLFALPAIRNTQVGAPLLGCTADLAGFFWNMPMVAVAAFLLMLNYIVSYRRVKD